MLHKLLIVETKIIILSLVRGCSAHLNVSVDYLIVMEVFEPLEDLFGVEDDGGLVVFQGTPFGAQERGQTSYKQ